jgi:hypothetical protein
MTYLRLLVLLGGLLIGLFLVILLHPSKVTEPKWIITQYGSNAVPIHSWQVIEPGHKLGKDYMFICQGVTNLIKWPYLITQDEITTNQPAH